MFRPNKRKSAAVTSAPLVKKASSSAVNQYAGAHDAAPIELAGECPSDLSEHVASRTPVHMRSLPANWRSKSAADLIAQLRRRADCSKVSVRVELRDDSNGQFGLGREAQWSLSDALDRIESGDERVYLSAQPLGEQCDGLAQLAASPMAELLRSGEFECRPSLLRALVPANVNLWLGFARSGASSGLHHDFHDNLYVLLAGEKEFLLVNPSYAERMYTYGQIARVHANGIINYVDALTRADGATPFQVRRFEHRVKLRSLEKAIDAAEEDLAKGVRGAKQRLAKAQRALIALAPLANDDSDSDGDANDDDDADDDENDGGLFGGADNDAAFDAHDDDSFDDAAAFGGSQHDDFDEVEAAEVAAAAATATEQQDRKSVV